jgi:hypothetical protein
MSARDRKIARLFECRPALALFTVAGLEVDPALTGEIVQ